MDGWDAATTVSQVGVVTLAAGAVVDSGAGGLGFALDLAGQEAPELDVVQDGGALVLASGIGVLAVGSILAAAQARRDGGHAPCWAGTTALALEVVGIAAIVAAPRLPGPEWAWEQAKFAALPFVIVQFDLAERASPSRGRVLDFAVFPTPSGLHVAGRF